MSKETIRVSLEQVFEAQRTLTKILNTPVELKLAYRMNKIADVLLRKFKEIEKGRVALVDQFGKDDGKGNTTVPENKVKEFTAAFKASLEKEVDLEVEPIPFSCLKTIPISAADMVAIQPFVGEPTEADLK